VDDKAFREYLFRQGGQALSRFVKPGEDLDDQIAEEALGWVRLEKSYYGVWYKSPDGSWGDPPNWSTSVEEVMELVVGLGYSVSLDGPCDDSKYRGKWIARVRGRIAHGDTPEHAVSLALLVKN